MAAPDQGPKDATPVTRAHNRAVVDALPFGDTRDFDDARRGFLATLPEVEIKNEQGRVVWSLRDYTFLGDDLGRAALLKNKECSGRPKDIADAARRWRGNTV